jgi:hypothetical protein
MGPDTLRPKIEMHPYTQNGDYKMAQIQLTYKHTNIQIYNLGTCTEEKQR